MKKIAVSLAIFMAMGVSTSTLAATVDVGVDDQTGWLQLASSGESGSDHDAGGSDGDSDSDHGTSSGGTGTTGTSTGTTSTSTGTTGRTGPGGGRHGGGRRG